MSSTDVKQKKDGPTTVQLFYKSLDKFLAKDMKGWTDLCDEGVVARSGEREAGESRDAILCHDGDVSGD